MKLTLLILPAGIVNRELISSNSGLMRITFKQKMPGFNEPDPIRIFYHDSEFIISIISGKLVKYGGASLKITSMIPNLCNRQKNVLRVIKNNVSVNLKSFFNLNRE